jgi:hypothetical protein
MFLTRHFVFVHIPKTGGNFVRQILEDHAPEQWQVQRLEDHATYDQIPSTHRDLPRIALARNPFSWHVSWFHFQQKNPHDFFNRISDGGKLGFAQSMRRAYTGDGPLANSSGALTQTLFEMLGQGLDGAVVGKMEGMRSELLRLFSLCTKVPQAMATAIEKMPPQNTSSHAHYSTYYDSELRDLIRAKDAPVFDFFGYEWSDS